MKKVILFAAFAVTGLMSQAQTTFGAKGGLNVAMLTGDDADGFDSKIGGHAGVFATIHMSSMLSLQPAVEFSMEGAKFDFGTDKAKLNLNYVNIPVMLQYRTNGFYAEVGPQLGLLVSAKLKVGSDDADVKDGFKSTSFGVGLGLGYDLKNNLGFGVRYTFGVANISEDSDGDLKTSVLQAGLHYSFGGMKK